MKRREKKTRWKSMTSQDKVKVSSEIVLIIILKHIGARNEMNELKYINGIIVEHPS